MNFIFKKIHNPGLNYLLIFFLVSTLNDLWSLTFGFPTLFHIFFLITLLFFRKEKVKKTSFLKNTYTLLVFYLIIVVINTFIYTFIEFNLENKVVSVFFKSVFLLIIITTLTKVKFYEIILFFKYVSIISVFFVLIPASIEFLLQRNLLSYEYGISDNIFYLRGLFIDKVDLGFFLIILTASVFSFHKYWNMNKYLRFSVISICCFFLVYSFSTTNLFGLLLSLIFIIMNQKGKFKLLIFSTIIIYSIVQLSSDYLNNYTIKYDLQSEKSNTGDEFRSRAFKESVTYFFESPFLGHGPSSNAKMIRNRVSWVDKEINSHNFISEFTDYGLFGGGILLSLFLTVFYKGFKQRNKENPIFIFWIIITGPIIMRVLFYYHYFDSFSFIFWISITILMVSFKTENNMNKIINN